MLALGEERERGVPGVVSSSHPLFHSRHRACAPRGCPSRLPRARFSLVPLASVGPADALSVSLFRGSRLPPANPLPLAPVVLVLLSSRRSASARLLSAFPLFSSFPWSPLLSAVLLSLSPVCVISLGHTRCSTSLRLPFRRARSFLAGDSRRIEFECARNAKAGHGFVP